MMQGVQAQYYQTVPLLPEFPLLVNILCLHVVSYYESFLNWEYKLCWYVIFYYVNMKHFIK